ncbi:MAG: nucleotidyltransferase family protein [Oscillospiraceae bacterium]|jgi:predicted nucleotidyltransferase|nr:nucleotidyltransferase family protein [Oscillospiraceae bacterium]
MVTAGIIAEYNPFHMGHIHHIAQTRRAGATHLVVLMSGNTVQRGEFAILRKEARARMALAGGADLVLCLPTPWSCARAQSFSAAAVHLMKSTGCIDLLSFGSESGDIHCIQRAAAALRERGVLESLQRRIGEGAPLAAARQAALEEVDFLAAQCLRQPNDTLNVEYLTQMRQQETSFQPLAIKRIGGEGYHSASELRIIIKSGEFLGEKFSTSIFREEFALGFGPVRGEALEAAAMARLRSMPPEALALLPDVSEGLEHLLWRAVRQGRCLEEIESAVVGRRYPRARVRRILFHALLGVSADDFTTLPGYIQILGFNRAGQQVLQRMKASASLPLIHRFADAKKLDISAFHGYEIESRATDLMALCMPNVQPCGMEERREIVLI